MAALSLRRPSSCRGTQCTGRSARHSFVPQAAEESRGLNYEAKAEGSGRRRRQPTADGLVKAGLMGDDMAVRQKGLPDQLKSVRVQSL